MSIQQVAIRSTQPAWLPSGRTAAAAVLGLALWLGGCATTSGPKLSRLQLGNQSTLEALLPAQWSWEPTMVSGPRLSLVRLFARSPETTQMRIIPRPDLRVPPAATEAQARELALRDLALSKDCEGLGTSIQTRRLSQGHAFYCTQPLPTAASASTSLLPTTAGVLVLPGLAARFAMLGVTPEEHTAAWSILHGMQVSTIVQSP